MQEILQKKCSTNYPIPNYSISIEYSSAWLFLSDLDKYYPNFKSWFFEKVIPDCSIDKRKIIVKKSADQIVAVAILKKSIEERKICTFRVSENAKRHGIGKELMLESLEWLQCNQPLITVNEENASEFEYFLRKFDFQKQSVLTNLYRTNKKEIIYNTSFVR
jgi:ribosomal protein S18 acetylase RimI-like enzyme